MNIKEIALKVADSLRNKVDGISHMQSNQGLVRFAEALVAEIQRQSVPVAEVLSLFPGEPDSYINARAIGVDPFNTWTFPQPGTKLYTIPPTAEQIANETAEACARVYLDTYDLTDIAEAIRSGAWKEFKKS